MTTTDTTHVVAERSKTSRFASTAGGPLTVCCGLAAFAIAYVTPLQADVISWVGAVLIAAGALWGYLAATQLLRQRDRWRAASRSSTLFRDALYRRNSATLRGVLASIDAADSHTRISLYLKDHNGFHLSGRYSSNPEYNRPGRHFIPDGQGYLWSAWQHGIAGACDLPAKPDAHAAEVMRRSSLPHTVAHNLRMRSRAIYGCRIDHLGATDQPFGAVIIESDAPRGIPPHAPAALTESGVLHELCADMTAHVAGAVPQHPDR